MDYSEVIRRSIRKDFAHSNMRKKGYAPIVPHPLNTKRVLSINERCEYYPFRRMIEGKIVRILSEGMSGVWVEFVNDFDRQRLNEAAGWNSKKKHLINAKFDK